jgi:xanthine dehydrogenase molybdenum-binding subunit
MENSIFLDYRMPTSLGLPMIETIIGRPNPGHPYGVRGVGGASIAPPPAVVAAAVQNVAGIQIDGLPLRPDRILAAMGDSLSTAAG